MSPAPTLEELIASVREDAPSDDPLDQLSQASQTAAILEEVGDALLGHFVEQSRSSGYSWSQISTALGVSKQAVHKRFSPSITIEREAVTFERFTARAKSVLKGASDETRRRGGENVEAQDVLLALFEPAESLAAQVLRDVQVTREACAQALGIETTTAMAESTEALPYSQSAKSVLTSALGEALGLKHNYIGTEHMLLGIYHDSRDPAAKALVALGATYDDVKARVAEKLAELTKQ